MIRSFVKGGKAAGVVIDDAAVTPKYVVGTREKLPINAIAGLLKNKFLTSTSSADFRISTLADPSASRRLISQLRRCCKNTLLPNG